MASILGLLLLAGAPQPRALADAEKAADAERAVDVAPVRAGRRDGRLIRVPLPITGAVDTQVIAAANEALRDMPDGPERPVLIFEFSSSGGETGEGSDFGRSLALARYLADPDASTALTVAYVPEVLKGHAVLPAIACEEIIMGREGSQIGEAGIDEPPEQSPNATLRSGYRETAERRRTIPPEVALAMLDKNLELLKVETDLGPEFALRSELDELRERRTFGESDITVLSPPGELLLLSGNEARQNGFAKYLVADRAKLAEELNLPLSALDDNPSLGGEWRPVRVLLEGPITPRAVSDVRRTIATQVRDRGVNFVCLEIDSPGGSLADSMSLVDFLANQDPAKVRIVAYVPVSAQADAALVAMAADQLVVKHDAVLGGKGELDASPEEIELVREPLRDNVDRGVAQNWSLTAALVDPSVRVYRYTNRRTGSVAYFSPEELAERDDAEEWNQGAEVTRGDQPLRVTGDRAGELGMARHVVEDFADLKRQYNLEGEIALAEPSWADHLIDALAAPAVAWMLLLIGGAALYAELQVPGIGIGAFVAGICFLLFFWSRFLDGTANWLEVLLFAAGICCVLLELFVLPGTGIFGLGGGLLVIVSLVLASQTFVIPHNAYEMRELRNSLLSLLAVGVCLGVAAMIMRRYLPHSPLFSMMMLEPPSHAELEDLSQRESMANFAHLLGMHGIAMTQLTPSGKARFAGELVDVIADSEVIDRGAEVVVSEVHGTRVVVRSAAGRA